MVKLNLAVVISIFLMTLNNPWKYKRGLSKGFFLSGFSITDADNSQVNMGQVVNKSSKIGKDLKTLISASP